MNNPAPGPESEPVSSGDAGPEPEHGSELGPVPQEFVLPLVARLERAAPPARTDALETAARAVLTLLADERARDGGEWGKAVRLWEERAIRKVVRRARGAEWRRAEALPGITVTGGGTGGAGEAGGPEDVEGAGEVHGAAAVRVFPPIPVDGWPKDLARLQVSGTELTDPAPPSTPADGVPVLWLSPHLRMSAGKAMAQAGHGAQLAWWELPERERAEWAGAGFPLAVRTAADGAAWSALVEAGLPVVRDAGFTEVAPGSCTVVSDHPALRHRARR